MQFGLKYDLKALLEKTIANVFNNYDVTHELVGLSQIRIIGKIDAIQHRRIEKELRGYGLELIDDHTSSLISRIKSEIVNYLLCKEKSKPSNISCFLPKKLGYSYAHLSAIFVSNTHCTLEKFVILQRIDIAKQLLMSERFTLTEIAFTLGFSSVSHLSGQFKKTTGLTPSTFKRILKHRSKL